MIITLPIAAGIVFASLMTAATAEAPTPRRENIEWCNIWVPDATSTALPRVLLIGDSICMGYYDGVANALHGKAYVARMATSASVGDTALLDQVRMILSQYRIDIIHLNVGLHGWDYTEAEYRTHLPDLLGLIKRKAPTATLIWAMTTPWRKPAPDTREFHANNERVKARNKIAAELMARRKIDTDDLFGLIVNHPEYWSADGVHSNGEGQAVEAEQVAACIKKALEGVRSHRVH
jgi:lysophospholipase L1-like esterase